MNKANLRPDFSNPDDAIEKRFAKTQDEFKRQLAQTKEEVRQEVEATVANELKKVTQSGKKEPAAELETLEKPSKIAMLIEDIKKRKLPNDNPVPSTSYSTQTTIHTPVIPMPVIPSVSHEQDNHHDIINCPTCHAGHVHAVAPDGVTFKCTGPNCGKEFVMVDKAADYKCVGCGSPIKKPDDEKIKMDDCPFCHGKKAVKFDWSKIWKVVAR